MPLFLLRIRPQSQETNKHFLLNNHKNPRCNRGFYFLNEGAERKVFSARGPVYCARNLRGRPSQMASNAPMPSKYG